VKIILIFVLILCFVCISCSDAGDPPTGNGGGITIDTVSFSSDIAPLIVNTSCLNSGCHGNGSSAGGLNLGSGTYDDIINATGTNGAIIIIDSALLSNFYLKLTSNPPFGIQMPLGSSALSTTSLDKVKDWINQGAEDN